MFHEHTVVLVEADTEKNRAVIKNGSVVQYV